MNSDNKIPINREDDDELLGYIIQGDTGWDAQTIFGYSIERVEARDDAERIVRTKGLSFLMGVWEYLDPDDHKWYPCVLKEAYEHKVVVLRTGSMGYQDPDDFKMVTIKNPSDVNLIKS